MPSTREDNVIPYGGVDKTIAETSKGILYKVLQTPGRLFWAGIMAGILIGTGYWLAYATGSSLWPYRVFLENSNVVFKHIGELLGIDALGAYHIDLVTLAKLIIGAVFPLGLIAILIGGAELWTSCPQLVVYPYATRTFGRKAVLYNWLTAYSGNIVGSIFLAFMATYGTSMLLGSPFFDTAFTFAYKKVHLDAWTAFWRGMGCNFLVNLAVWLWLRSKAKDIAGQVLVIWFPIFAFVAIGFEHSIANQFAIPVGIFSSSIKWGTYTITYSEFFFNNLLPVTYGNLVGALVFITLYYWYMGSVKGSKIGEAKPANVLKVFVEVAILLAIVFLALEVLVPGLIATAVEHILGLEAGAKLTNSYIALLPGIIVSIYYVLIPFIAYKILKPYTDIKQ